MWGVDLANMQVINKFNKRIQFLLQVIKTHNIYAWVVNLKDIKGIIITNAFQEILWSETSAMQDESGHDIAKS